MAERTPPANVSGAIHDVAEAYHTTAFRRATPEAAVVIYYRQHASSSSETELVFSVKAAWELAHRLIDAAFNAGVDAALCDEGPPTDSL